MSRPPLNKIALKQARRLGHDVGYWVNLHKAIAHVIWIENPELEMDKAKIMAQPHLRDVADRLLNERSNRNGNPTRKD